MRERLELPLCQVEPVDVAQHVEASHLMEGREIVIMAVRGDRPMPEGTVDDELLVEVEAPNGPVIENGLIASRVKIKQPQGAWLMAVRTAVEQSTIWKP
ncbi:hypothetical protein D3C86_1828950 [compost metagenome]